MSVDNQIVEMLRDRFDSQDVVLQDIKESIRDHTEKDEAYWRQIDDQKAQLRLVKWLGGTSIAGSAVLWAWHKLLGL
jgi:RNA binding exosome subunit